jgi:hypothetical protein
MSRDRKKNRKKRKEQKKRKKKKKKRGGDFFMSSLPSIFPPTHRSGTGLVDASSSSQHDDLPSEIVSAREASSKGRIDWVDAR